MSVATRPTIPTDIDQGYWINAWAADPRLKDGNDAAPDPTAHNDPAHPDPTYHGFDPSQTVALGSAQLLLGKEHHNDEAGFLLIDEQEVAGLVVKRYLDRAGFAELAEAAAYMHRRPDADGCGFVAYDQTGRQAAVMLMRFVDGGWVYLHLDPIRDGDTEDEIAAWLDRDKLAELAECAGYVHQAL